MKFLHLLWRNLTRNKVRTLFTFLSVLVAFFLFGLLFAIRAAFDAGIEIAGNDRLLTIHKVSIIQPLPIRYLNGIRSTEGVTAATHASWFGGVYQDPKNFFAQIAVDPEEYLDLYPEFVVPDDQRQRWISTRTGAMVGKLLADRFGWSIGDKIPIQPTFWRPMDGGPPNYEFEVTAIYEGASREVDQSQFFFHYDYLSERTGNQGLIGWYVVRLDDPEAAVGVAQAIDAQFANSSAETKTTTEKAFMQGFAKQIGNTGAILMAIVAIVFFVILLIAANTMAQSVRERISELGVLKTLGFSDRGVLGLVLGESTLLSALAGVLGIGFAVASTPVLRNMVESFLPVFFVPTAGIVTGILLAIALGLVAGFPPAWQAMRLQIVDALRRS